MGKKLISAAVFLTAMVEGRIHSSFPPGRVEGSNTIARPQRIFREFNVAPHLKHG